MPFRFGAQLYGAPRLGEWREAVKRAESLGYAIVTIPDHLGERPGPWPTIVAAAGATSTLRFGTLTINNDLWNPVVLARDAATADVFSEGRVELGVGAGWKMDDYRWTGIARDPIGTRIARLAESVAIIKACFAGTTFDHRGEHFKLGGTEGWPPPVQSPLPIFIGGSGPRILGLAAREADIVGIHVNLKAQTFGGATDADVEARVEHVNQAAGVRAARLELHLFVLEFEITTDRQAAASLLAPALGMTIEQALNSPYLLLGTVQEITSQLERCRERYGISYFTVRSSHVESFAPIVARLAGR
jgi:probable F420-dependent oxidoreductase